MLGVGSCLLFVNWGCCLLVGWLDCLFVWRLVVVCVCLLVVVGCWLLVLLVLPGKQWFNVTLNVSFCGKSH